MAAKEQLPENYFTDGGQLASDAELFREVDFGEVKPVESKRRTTTTRTPRRNAKLAALQSDLAEEVALFGAITSSFSPTFGYVIVEDSNDAAAALIRLAQDKPWALKALERAAEVGTGVKLGKMAVRWGTAFAVDREMIAPDALFAQMMRVTPAWIETHPEEVRQAEANGWQRPPMVPRFSGNRATQ